MIIFLEYGLFLSDFKEIGGKSNKKINMAFFL